MSSSTQAGQEYLRSAVLTASPEQLQLMLLDGAVRFATRGLEALRRREREAVFNALDRAQRIVLELGQGLRREVNPDLVDQMQALYNFIYRRLIDANLHLDEAALQDALQILRHQRETWALLIEKLAGAQAADRSSAPSAQAPTSAPALPAPRPSRKPRYGAGPTGSSQFVAEA
jgi:flagellar protein FliS